MAAVSARAFGPQKIGHHYVPPESTSAPETAYYKH